MVAADIMRLGAATQCGWTSKVHSLPVMASVGDVRIADVYRSTLARLTRLGIGARWQPEFIDDRLATVRASAAVASRNIN